MSDEVVRRVDALERIVGRQSDRLDSIATEMTGVLISASKQVL